MLAALKHPPIAHVLDGATTDHGLHYFVMEYIEGRPIDEYCDKQKLDKPRQADSWRARLPDEPDSH